MPRASRNIIENHGRDEALFQEIAAALGVSSIAVRVRAVRARAKLKRALEKLAAKNL